MREYWKRFIHDERPIMSEEEMIREQYKEYRIELDNNTGKDESFDYAITDLKCDKQ